MPCDGIDLSCIQSRARDDIFGVIDDDGTEWKEDSAADCEVDGVLHPAFVNSVLRLEVSIGLAPRARGKRRLVYATRQFGIVIRPA